nr:hypothetical protein [Tanacetum cinerariifolium]
MRLFKRGFIDKFVHDPNKTIDSSQRPPRDCPKCGSPVDDFLNTFESSSDDSNTVNIPKEPFVFNQDPNENSSQSHPHVDHHCCFGCGDSLDGIFCQRRTCKSCGKGAHYGYNYPSKVLIISNLEPCHNQNVEEFLQTLPSFHPTCYSRDGNSFAYVSTLDFVNDSSNVFNPPSQPPMRKRTLIMGDEHLDTIPEKESDKFIKSSVENLVPNPSESEDERECDVSVCDDFTTFFNLLFDVDDNFSFSDNESFSNKDILKEIYSNPLFDEEIISIKIDPHHFNAESDLIESLLNQDSLISSSSKIDSLLDEFADELIFLKLIPPGIDEANCNPEEEIQLIEKLLYDNSSPRPLEEINSENSDAVIESFSPSTIPVEDSDPFIEEIDLFLTSNGSIPPGIDSDYSDSKR